MYKDEGLGEIVLTTMEFKGWIVDSRPESSTQNPESRLSLPLA
jgi:hypothetical protein